VRRIRRHLTFANVVACLALFVALGGTGYAAFRLPKNSVGTKQIKNNSITGAKLKTGAITGSKIALASLGTVPSATRAASAGTADTATKANSATTATTAGDASSLQGQSAAQIKAASKLTCPTGTTLVAGFCVEEEAHAETNWLAATRDCAKRGRELPSAAQLAAYDFALGVTEQEWVDGVYSNGAGMQAVALKFTEGGAGAGTGTWSSPGSVEYRCVVAPSN
jgi:hypothetical protein